MRYTTKVQDQGVKGQGRSVT